jgi:hypothetical protein
VSIAADVCGAEMKMLLVWVILSAAACTGKCAVDLERAPFVCSVAVIGESFQTAAFSNRLTKLLFVEVLACHTLGICEVRQTKQRDTTTWTPGGRLQQSWHGLTVAKQNGPRNASPGSGISQLDGLANGGLSLCH